MSANSHTNRDRAIIAAVPCPDNTLRPGARSASGPFPLMRQGL